MTLGLRKEFRYDGELLGKSYDDIPGGKIIFTPEDGMDIAKVRDLLERIPTDHLLHLQDSARAVHKLCIYFGIDFREYIIGADIQEHILQREYQSLEEVKEKDKTLYRMIKAKGLEDSLLYELSLR